MPLEIERKFLVVNEAWRAKADRSTHIKQGYISSEPDHTVRVRICDNNAWLTIKGRNNGITRPEYEISLEKKMAEELFTAFCGSEMIIKTRHFITYEGFIWEVDEFEGPLKGLVVAEIELPSESTDFKKPSWLGKEVSADHRFYNSSLIKCRSLSDLS